MGVDISSKLTPEQIDFFAELPLLLNSSLNVGTIIDTILRYVRFQLSADSVAIVLGSSCKAPVYSWTLKREASNIEEQKTILSEEARVAKVLATTSSSVDVSAVESSGDKTAMAYNIELCLPLVARESVSIGALQVVWSQRGDALSEQEQTYLEHICHQVAMALHNALLFKQIKRANLVLSAVNRKKDDMLSVISHELKTPVNILQNSLEMLDSPNLDQKSRKKLKETLLRGFNRVSLLASKIKEASVTSDADLDVYQEPFDLSELCASIEDQFREPCANRSLNFSVELGAPRLLVNGDQALIMIALSNLISNAIRFTPDGGSVFLEAQLVEGNYVEVRVRDTGIGVEQEEIPALFEKFYTSLDAQYHHSGTFEFQSGGLGLGLSTVRGIVEAHGSKLRVESSPGSGSCFSFQLGAVT